MVPRVGAEEVDEREILDAGLGHSGIIDRLGAAVVGIFEAPILVIPLRCHSLLDRHRGNEGIIREIVGVELPGLVIGKEHIAGRMLACVHGNHHGDVVVIGGKTDVPDTGRLERFAPVADVLLPQRLDAQPIAAVHGGVARVDGELGAVVVGDVVDEIASGLYIRGADVLLSSVVFNPDDGLVEIRSPPVHRLARGRPHGMERSQPDPGNVADADVAVDGHDSFRSLLDVRRVRIDAGRGAKGDGHKSQDLSHS